LNFGVKLIIIRKNYIINKKNI